MAGTSTNTIGVNGLATGIITADNAVLYEALDDDCESCKL
jgi:hypothetical protein